MNTKFEVATAAPEEIAAAMEKLHAEQAWAAERPKKFLDAWKRGIKLVGEDYFIIEGNLDNVTDKWQLKPNTKLIEHSLLAISRGKATFLATMYCFYNDEDGQRYLKQLGRTSIADISTCLDREYLEVIAELFMNYSGW